MNDSCSDAVAIARGFQAANDADTMTIMNVMSSRKQSEVDKLFFYVVNARWLRHAWPVLSGRAVIDSNNGDNTDNDALSISGDWRSDIGKIENAELLLENAAISSSSSDEDEHFETDVSPARNRTGSNNPTAPKRQGERKQRHHHHHHPVMLGKKALEARRMNRNNVFERDYFLFGPNAWLLLKEKFGVDVEIALRCVFTTSSEAPMAVELEPDDLSGGHPAPHIYIPPTGHFRYDSAAVLSNNTASSSLTRASSASTTTKSATTTTAALATISDKRSAAEETEAETKAISLPSSPKRETTHHPGNVSDDETDDLFPSLEEMDDDRMSTDQHQDQSANTNGPILLLPASTTYAGTAAADGSSSSPVWMSANNHNNNNNYNYDAMETSSSNDFGVVGSPGNNNVSTVALRVPAQLRRPYGSGLGNLGNTCFMNSTLQCLAHTEPLRKYFLSGEYDRDLNPDNPLGTGGDLAIQFANLLAEMWGTGSNSNGYGNNNNNGYGSTSFSTSVVYPRSFKYTLGRHAEQFVGYDQHDSQELATYLLDALHEDTNRVTKKPYVEKPEQGEDETDEDAAGKAWALHLKREDSKVLEYFMGQVKSRVQCCKEECGRVSTTFDPTMYLSVPIPGSSERTLHVTFVPLNSSMRAQDIPISISKTALFPDVTAKLVQQLQKFRFLGENETIAAEDLCFVDVFQKNVYSWFKDSDGVDGITDTDTTYAYQLRPLAEVQKHEEEQERAGSSPAEAERLKTLGIRERTSPKRYRLDLASLTQLNRGADTWSTKMMSYLKTSGGFISAFNPNRGSVAEQVRWYNKVCTFIDNCYQNDPLTGQKRSREEKESGDSYIMVSPDEDPLPFIRDRSDISPTFDNVAKRHDVATLEFIAGKMLKEIQTHQKQEHEHFPNGVVVQIRIRKFLPTAFPSGKEQSLSAPFILRIPSDMTVYGLRETLAKRVSRALKTGHPARPSSLASGESTSERAAFMHDNNHAPGGSFGDPAMLIIRQVPLAYDRADRNQTFRSHSSGTKLGVLEKGGENNDGSRPVSLAAPTDEEEKVSVAQLVGEHGKIYMDWPEELAERCFDEREFEIIEQLGAPRDDEEPGAAAGIPRTVKSLSVLDCIEKYCQMEQLEETEMWYCSRCKEHVRAWKQFHLYRSSPILIVHLKRFQYSATTHRRDKINTFIDFPLEGLDLTGQVMHWNEDQKPIYDCFAVSNHYGGLGGGHYTAYALNDDGVWCHYDDSRVTTHVDPKEVVSSSAYVLYYRRRDVPVGEQFFINMQTVPFNLQKHSPAIIQDPLDKIGESSDDVSSSNVALVDEEEGMDVDDTDLASRATSPMGSIEGTGDQFDDPEFDPTTGPDGDLEGMPLQ